MSAAKKREVNTNNKLNLQLSIKIDQMKSQIGGIQEAIQFKQSLNSQSVSPSKISSQPSNTITKSVSCLEQANKKLERLTSQ